MSDKFRQVGSGAGPTQFNQNDGNIDALDTVLGEVVKSRSEGYQGPRLYVILDPKQNDTLTITQSKKLAQKFGKMTDIATRINTYTENALTKGEFVAKLTEIYAKLTTISEAYKSKWTKGSNKAGIAKINKTLTAMGKNIDESIIQVQRRLLHSMFNLQLLPDRKIYKDFLPDVLSAQQKFVDTHFPDKNKAATIFAQNKTYPLMQKAVRELKKSYAQWTTICEKGTKESMANNAELNALKSKMAVQHANLLKLSAILTEIPNKEGLRQITLIPSLAAILEPYITGKKALEATDIASLKDEISKLAKSSTPDSSKEKKPAIEKQFQHSIMARAEVMGVERQAKTGAASVKQHTHDSPINQIYTIHSKEGEIIGYAKKTGGDVRNTKAAAIMEKLAYDLAQIWHMDDMFVDPRRTDLKIPDAVAEKTTISLQAAKGINLRDYKKKNGTKLPDIPKSQIIKGTIASLILGLNDLHGLNVLVYQQTGQNQLKFFDNARCLPHSNEAIQKGDVLLTTYRSALLEFDASYEELTPNERAEIKEMLLNCKSKLEQIEKRIRQATHELPERMKEWLKPSEAIPALRERIELMIKAVDDPKNRTLQQMIMAINPIYRFTTLLEQIIRVVSKGKIPDKQTLKEEANITGRKTLTELIDEVVELGVNAQDIWKICMNNQLSFDEMLVQVRKLYNEQIRNQTGNTYVENKDKADALKKSLNEKAKEDLKEVPYELTFSIRVHKKIRATGIHIFNRKSIPADSPFPYVTFDEAFPTTINFHYLDSKKNPVFTKIDYLTKPGSLLIEGKELHPKDLYLYRDRFFHPEVDKNHAEDLLKDKPEKSWLLYAVTEEQDRQYYLAKVTDNGTIHHVPIEYDHNYDVFFNSSLTKTVPLRTRSALRTAILRN